MPLTARKALGVGALAVTALLAFAVPASAHIPKVHAVCKEDVGKTYLKVDLTKYNPHGENTVKVTHGDEVLVNEDFETDFTETWEFDGTVDHAFKVVVRAWDDPDGEEGWSIRKELSVKACKAKPPVEEPPVEEPPVEQPPVQQPPAAPPQAAPPPAVGGGLANTGVSIFVPLGVGVLLLAGGAVLVVMRRRNSGDSAS